MAVDESSNVRPLSPVDGDELCQLRILLRSPRSTRNEVVELLAGNVDDLLAVTIGALCENANPELSICISSRSTTWRVDELRESESLVCKHLCICVAQKPLLTSFTSCWLMPLSARNDSTALEMRASSPSVKRPWV